MINIFDLSAGMSGAKVLTDKARSPIKKGREDAMKDILDTASHLEDKWNNERRSPSNKKSGGTPVKMLIAREMTKEMETWQKPPTVVARLMGLDVLPVHQSHKIAQGVVSQEYGKQISCKAGQMICTPHKQEFVHGDGTMPHNDQLFHSQVENRVYKDVYEVRNQPSRIKLPRKPPSNTENSIEQRMALVRQKFMEAKRLATNQKLLHSKEFQDALEVLSSNRDIFLKFLEEPNSLISNHIESQTVPMPGQCKRITVLKPSKTLDAGAGKLQKDQHPKEVKGFETTKHKNISDLVYPKAEQGVCQMTRIVVLKPCLGKLTDEKAATVFPSLPTKPLERIFSFDDLGMNRSRRSKEVAKEITRHIRESFCGSNRDETVVSSVQSNGYIGDESSFNRSEVEYMEEDCNSEAITPTSRHSWDYISRLDSPFSEQSLSQKFCSPESSVTKEAKKRLSERLVMVSLNQVNHEKEQEWRNTSTLGEMLSVPRDNKEHGWKETHGTSISRPYGVGKDLMVVSSSYLFSNRHGVEEEGETPMRLQRSKSLPVIPSLYEKVEMDTKDPTQSVKSKSVNEESITKSTRSRLKTKLSKLFFSRTKKFSKENPFSSPFAITSDETQGENSVNLEGAPPTFEELLMTEDSGLPLEKDRENQAISSFEEYIFCEVGCLNKEPFTRLSFSETPSKSISSRYSDIASTGSERKSNARYSDIASTGSERTISRSSPIESIARSLSCDGGTHSGRIALNPLKHPNSFLKEDVEEQERLVFVESLLSSAGLGTETSSTFLARWHSLDSPLNPALLDKLFECKEKTRCRERKSNQKLLFDCVNAALLDISWSGILSIDYLRKSSGISVTTNSVTEDVLRRINDWFSNTKLLTIGYCGGNSCVDVDIAVRKEVSGKGWSDTMGSEIAEMGMLIEGHILEELVREALDDFTLR